MENNLVIDSAYLLEHKHHSEDSLKIIDSFEVIKNGDTTVLVETTEKQYKILEKIIEKEDYGKNIFLILVSIFIIYSIYRKRNG